MNANEKKVFCAAVVILIIATIYPPVSDTISYEDSSGISSFQGVVRYEFLFTKSVKKINYPRLALEYLLVSLVAAGSLVALSSKRKQADNRTAQRISDLTETKEQLKSKVTRADWENERLQRRQKHLEARIEQLDADMVREHKIKEHTAIPISEMKPLKAKKPEDLPKLDQNV